ncbi:MAG: mobile mystery protein A [Alphaproteobacteria bacterium]|nr:MAG: mobile mystery protein A [Alphaproteobacteria bacterium]
MKNIAYKQLDRKLAKLASAGEFARPARGWVRAVREALGITTTQLAKRLGMSQPSVIGMEKAEQRGAISIETLERAARALNCTLVYAFVPNSSLEETLKEQARKVAKKRLDRVSHSMRLEDQGVSGAALKAEYERLVGELLRGNLHRLWDDDE